MKSGQVTMPVFQNLEAFWPGVLSLIGDQEAALKTLHNYHQVGASIPLPRGLLARCSLSHWGPGGCTQDPS